MLLSRVLSPNRENLPSQQRGIRRFQLRKRWKRVARTITILSCATCIIIPILYYSFRNLLGDNIPDLKYDLSSLKIERFKNNHDFLGLSGLWGFRKASQSPHDVIAMAESNLYDSTARMLERKSPRYRLLVVAKVGLEASYVLEWIEFHRLQGVDKFVLYIDDSPYLQNRQASTLKLLSAYYAQRGILDLIDLKSSADLIQDQLANILEFDDPLRSPDDETSDSSTTTAPPSQTTTGLTTSSSGERHALNPDKSPAKFPLRGQLVNFHRLGQQTLLKQAWAQYATQTEWFIHIDVDEFLYSTQHETLIDYFEDLYRMGDAPPSEQPDRDIGLLYQNGEMSGIYMHSRNFGITDSYWFTPTVSLERNPVTGNISLHYTPLVPLMTSSSPELRLKDMIYNLTQFVNGGFSDVRADEMRRVPPNPLKLFSEVYSMQDAALRNSLNASEYEEITAYPFQLERQFFRAPAIQDTDTLAILKKIVQVWPECKVVQDEILTNLATYKNLLNDKTRLKSYLKAKNLPDWCAPGHMPAGLTSMGKSILWTGRRYKPPKTYDHEDKVRKSGWLKPRRQRAALLSNRSNPEFCTVPWVHGCAHATKYPTLISKLLTLDHHMFRSLESRTVADVSWRSPNGWGKFSTKNSTSFAILEYTNLLFSPEARNRFLKPLKTKFYDLHEPIRAKERLHFTETRLQRIVETGRCTNVVNCQNA